METRIQAIKFDATEKLEAYIDKKLGKLGKFFEQATSADVILKVVKPESAVNKEVEITIFAPNQKFFASKIADTFEQAADECVVAIEKQIEKKKKKSFKNKLKTLFKMD
ncbi:MAG: ribosome-associated translation inhibitor RaiA [Prevotellaceae bacterium]|jgi:putative sigma-54 modulation protein|nr:ribosome-associated translation inhibitor RaiA [Prevotellaceae bacterium]